MGIIGSLTMKILTHFLTVKINYQLIIIAFCKDWELSYWQKFRKRLLDQLHDAHSGISKMKAIVLSHIWRPKLDKDIEKVSKHCTACQKNRLSPPRTPLQPWIWSKQPWDRVHIDYAQKDKKNYLLLVNSYSKWLESMQMLSTTFLTIEAL